MDVYIKQGAVRCLNVCIDRDSVQIVYLYKENYNF